MKTPLIDHRILSLLNSSDSKNQFIGLQLLISQHKMNLFQALKFLKPIIVEQEEDNVAFTCRYLIDEIEIEYQYNTSYIPYMDSQSTLFRLAFKHIHNKKEDLESFATMIALDDDLKRTSILDLIHKDFMDLRNDLISLIEIKM